MQKSVNKEIRTFWKKPDVKSQVFFYVSKLINVDDQVLTCVVSKVLKINQQPDEEEDEHEEAITQKLTCNKDIEHLNAL
jgi:hypothetical protein